MKYYTTVSYMSGHNSKIEALNNEVRNYADALVTSKESMERIIERMKEICDYLNRTYTRCKEISCDVYTSGYGTPYIAIGYHCEQQATIWFHEIKREV